MRQYLDLVNQVMEEGTLKPSRTGVGTLSYFSASYRVDLQQGFPLLTTKKVNFNAMLRELLWYLSGDPHIRNLRQHTKIWDAWADESGNLETAYGYYWRSFPSVCEMVEWEQTDGKVDLLDNRTIYRIDQIGFILNELKKNPFSRRLVLTAWDPGNAIKSKLPPCHYSAVFNVQRNFRATCEHCGHKTIMRADSVKFAPSNYTWMCVKCLRNAVRRPELQDELCCHLSQRSCDIALGVPFNLACYATLTQMVAQEVGLPVGIFAHSLIDAHIYHAAPEDPMHEYDHLAGLRIQATREPRGLPTLKISKKPFDQLKFEDFELVGYDPHPAIQFKVAV